MFRDAAIDGEIEQTPCILTNAQFGPLVDKDPILARLHHKKPRAQVARARKQAEPVGEPKAAPERREVKDRDGCRAP